MKTEKQVRTWWAYKDELLDNGNCVVFKAHISKPNNWKQTEENFEIIHLDDHQEIVAGLEARIEKLREALQKIADEDFRGNRPSGSLKAYQALKDDEAGK